MLCALTVRQLKAGMFDQFAAAFGPPADEAPPSGWVRFNLIRDTADENRVVTFGFFDGTMEELERNQAAQGYEERRDAAGEFIEAVVVNGVFDVVVDLHAG
jgi:hypothetical protein